MRLFNLFPWRFVLRRIAHRKGFMDPLELLARLRRFSQPSEVQEPIELIRAGMIFHARGLVNTKVIQNNLDWIWPYWIVRQFSPDDTSFIPRAFSFSHVNLTHRNWTAVGLPGCLELPIVDPRGMVTPHHDEWSVDHWFVADDSEHLFPSALVEADQRLVMEDGHAVETRCENVSAELSLRTEMLREADGQPILETTIEVRGKVPGRLVVSTRPCNPEGIQFIDKVSFGEDRRLLQIGKASEITFVEKPDECYTSDYHHGDVLSHVLAGSESFEKACPAGLATAAAAFRVGGGGRFSLKYRIPIVEEKEGSVLEPVPETIRPASWEEHMRDWSGMRIPDKRMEAIFESSKRTLALLSQSDILPGPYTYRRFWFRDACIIANALIGLGQDGIVRKSLNFFHRRQKIDGYFHSQEGEWDSNGQVLWLANRYEVVTGETGSALDTPVIFRAARWIDRKRRKTSKESDRHRGLLPAGFSAEHLGPNDYYYWDDFWAAGGLRAAQELLERRDEADKAAEVARMADDFEQVLQANLEALDPERVGDAIPAAPTRRMDSGAIGSMVADYPLDLPWVPKERLVATADWLLEHSLHKGGFFQNMIHSGINAYLTLDLAQTYLRMGDPRYRDLIQATANIASPTGKWPEAVHPLTEGGCMGDGEHAWAAAEWCQAMRALFVEEGDNTLRIGKGIPRAWLDQEEPLSFGPTLTRWGKVSVFLEKQDHSWTVRLEADWNGETPELKVCLPGREESKLTVQSLSGTRSGQQSR